jgi:hypothetical protein
VDFLDACGTNKGTPVDVDVGVGKRAGDSPPSLPTNGTRDFALERRFRGQHVVSATTVEMARQNVASLNTCTQRKMLALL